jgi:hypothetical protein
VHGIRTEKRFVSRSGGHFIDSRPKIATVGDRQARRRCSAQYGYPVVIAGRRKQPLEATSLAGGQSNPQTPAVSTDVNNAAPCITK